MLPSSSVSLYLVVFLQCQSPNFSFSVNQKKCEQFDVIKIHVCRGWENGICFLFFHMFIYFINVSLSDECTFWVYVAIFLTQQVSLQEKLLFKQNSTCHVHGSLVFFAVSVFYCYIAIVKIFLSSSCCNFNKLVSVAEYKLSTVIINRFLHSYILNTDQIHFKGSCI